MKYSNVIIISSNKIDTRIRTLFAVDELLDTDVYLEYWNVSALTYKSEIADSEVNMLKVCVIDTMKDFEDKVRINRTKDCLYIVYMNYCYVTYACYRVLAKNKAHILYCVNGLSPEVVTIGRRKYLDKHLLSKILTRLAKKTSLIAPAKYELLTSGKTCLDYKVDKHTKVLRYNTTDYTTIINLANETITNSKGNYIVFIDQYLPFHPDAILVGEKHIQPEPYYSRLNLLFSKIEKVYNCKVIIAAHPASIKYKEHNYYDARDVVFGKTGQLIKESIGVIAHCSTALSFPVVYKKKMIMLTSNEIKSNLVYSFANGIEYCALQRFHCPLINIDDDNYTIHFDEVDENAYNEYKYDYLTNRESEYVNNYETLLSIIEGRI